MATPALTLPADFIAQLVAPFVEAGVQAHLAALPTPDPMYPVGQVAEILGLHDEATVRGYFGLPAGHPRRLPFVETSDSPRGRRVRLSAIRAWQERNGSDFLAEVPALRPAKRAA